MDTKLTYLTSISRVSPTPRSRRLQHGAVGVTGVSALMSVGGVASAGSTSDGHKHPNKASLDSMTTDSEGYEYISRYVEVPDPETGLIDIQLVTEKVKAGFADMAALARDLTEDSPVRKAFLSRLVDDTALGLITLAKGLIARGRAAFGNFVAGESGAKIDPDGTAEFEEVTIRRKVTVGAPVVAGVSGGGLWVDEYGNVHLQVDFAEVTKKAIFAEAEVKKLRHVGGVIILSPASMECNAVERVNGGYKCFFATEDADYPGRKVSNEFAVGDQARCQTCNLVEGTTRNAANRYYWRKVIEVGEDYIVLSEKDCDPAGPNDEPQAGDSIIQMGNAIDPLRQNLIIIAAYGAQSPYIYQFKGINTYALPDAKAKTKISPYGNRFTGEFTIEAGTESIPLADYVSHFRLVADSSTYPVRVDPETGLPLQTAMQVSCKPFIIKNGAMIPLEGQAMLKAGGNFLRLGDGLITLLRGDGEQIPGILTLVYTAFKPDPKEKFVADRDFTDCVYTGPLTLKEEWARVDFTLWFNGEKVAAVSVEGPARTSAISTTLAVLEDRIEMGVMAGLRHTGIDIEDRKITLKADNVEILNNAGQQTASFDADGNFMAHRVAAFNAEGKVIAMMNAWGGGEYVMFYPETGVPRMVLSPDPDRSRALVYYDEQGRELWKLGANGLEWIIAQRFVTVGGYSDAAGQNAMSDADLRESPLFIFRADQGSPNFAYDGIYYTKDSDTDLTRNQANGRYYSCKALRDAGGQYRSYMEFQNGQLTTSGKEYLN